MPPRRPDARTERQRADHAARSRLVVQHLQDCRSGSSGRDIRSVYVEEIRRGTGCRVLVP